MIDRPIFSASPLLIPAISFMAGIAYGRMGNNLPEHLTYQLLFIAALLVVAFSTRIITRKILISGAIILLFFVTGSVHIHKIREPDAPSHIHNLIRKPTEVTLAGTLQSISSAGEGNGRLVVSAAEILKKDGSSARTHGLVLLNTDFSPASEFTPGSQVFIRADIARITRNGTPGTFDYRHYLADRNIFISGWARSPASISLAHFEAPPETLLTSATLFFQNSRNNVGRFISSSDLSNTTRGLYAAILTGERGEIPPDVLQNFRISGTFHLLAISGMHMSLLFLLSTFIVTLILKSSTRVMLLLPVWKISALLSLIPLVYYTAISGANPPAVRAFIMIALLITAVVSDRQNSIFNSLCLASIIILALDPPALFSASFQLSFAAVAGIIIYNNRFPLIPCPGQGKTGKLHALMLWGRSSVIISLTALAVTAPLTIYYFHQASILGPLTTLLAAPAICFISLPLGLISSLIHQLFPAAAYFLLDCGSLGLVVAAKIAETGATIPFASMSHAPPTIFQIIFYYLFLFALLRVSRSAKSLVLPLIFLLAVLISPFIINILTAGDGATRISFIDVGKGNATLLELPGGKNILIDGGASGSDAFNAGERIIAPFLWHKRIRKLEAIVITHAHSDHFNGLEHIIDYFKPETLWVNGSRSEDGMYERVLTHAGKNGVMVRIPEDDAIISKSGATTLSCLRNLHLHQPGPVPENSRSLVLKIASHGRTVILPGDLMKGDGKQISAGDKGDRIDLLLAPHHGSETSASRELLDSMKPLYLVVSGRASRKHTFSGPESEKSRKPGTTRFLDIRDRGTVTFTISPEDFTYTLVSDKGSAT